MSYQFRPVLLAVAVISFISGNLALSAQDPAQAVTDEIYLLRNGKIVHIAGIDPEEVNLRGDVTAIFTADTGVYYIRHDDTGYAAGFYTTAPAGSYEYQVLHQSYTVERFIVSEKILYILFRKPGELNGSFSSGLVRLNPATGVTDTLDSVADFGIIRGELFILRGRGIEYRGASIPLMLDGELRVRSVVDDRLVLVGSGTETEVCDVAAGRNIYQYGAAVTYPVNSEYNLVLEFVDRAEGVDSVSPDGNMVYYNIIINGYEDERTETAPGRVVKTSYLNLDPGETYLVRMERWELDRLKGKYLRANNIMQPRELKVYIPENRGLKIVIEYTGSGYSISQGVYRGDEK